MQSIFILFSTKSHRFKLVYCVLFLIPFASLPLGVFASNYYRHIFFDNSVNLDRHFYSGGGASGSSSLYLDQGKLPVDKSIFKTPPNALSIKYQSNMNGAWMAVINLDRWRQAEISFIGDTLYFWCYAKDAQMLPRVQLNDFGGGFTSPLNLKLKLPANKWIQVSIPFSKFVSSSQQPFTPSKLSNVSFVQGNADSIEHILIIDEIGTMQRMPAGRGRSQAENSQINISAKGYDRHIDIQWRGGENAERFIIYRSFDGKDFRPIGIQKGDIYRYSDFIGERNNQAFYKITASNKNYIESPPSNIASATTRELSDDEMLTMLQEANFRYYWEAAEPESGMARENIPGDENMIATGATGFGIMAMVVGVERGFVTRDEVLQRLLKITDYLEKADRFHGVWPHFINAKTKKPIPIFGKFDNGGDTVETAFLMQGLLVARQYYKESKVLYDRITKLWESVEWDWYTRSPENKFLYWHWSSDYGWAMNHKTVGWNECFIAYFLAMKSPTHSIPGEMYYSGWRGGSDKDTFKPEGPLFFTHYSFLGLDPRKYSDKYLNYFEHNQKQAIANYNYCMENPKKFKGYGHASGPNLHAGALSGGGGWGLTASDNPWGYGAHAPNPNEDNGTISPTGALSSFPYTPKESMQAFRYFYDALGDRLWNIYGFRDAYNLNENWFANIYLGLDQAPVTVMIENYRTGLIWKLFAQNF